MEKRMKKRIVEISEFESSLISGGRSEELAAFIEMVAQCAGTMARLVYLFVNKGQKCIATQAINGYYYKF